MLPLQTFAGLSDSIRLQKELNKIATGSPEYATAKYNHNGDRIIQPEDADLETLG